MADQFRGADKGNMVEGGRCVHAHCIVSDGNRGGDLSRYSYIFM